ncbi:hypothetical protein ACLOJK_000290 [Asimina triloba]
MVMHSGYLLITGSFTCFKLKNSFIMASTRKPRMLNKRFTKVIEESPEKDSGNSNKSKQRKRKLSVMLGSQWSKEELERFYDAYRKYGKDWKKVASFIRNRSADMVEALYNMNKAYLSLPEGATSVAGLIAMMTDHYNLLHENSRFKLVSCKRNVARKRKDACFLVSREEDGSDSERESNDGLGVSRKTQKRGRGKYKPNSSKGSDGPFPDLLQHQSLTSTYGCLSLLKKKRSGGNRPRAVGKRTPRFPVSYLHDRTVKGNNYFPNKQGLKSAADADDDDVARVAALALAEASQRGGSPQVSRTPSRRTENMKPSPIQSGEKKQAESEIASTKAADEDGLEGSLGSREAENGDFIRETESAGAIGHKKKAKKGQGKRRKTQGVETNHFEDVREACSGTEEGLTSKVVKDEIDVEVTDGKGEGSRKRSRQLFFGAHTWPAPYQGMRGVPRHTFYNHVLDKLFYGQKTTVEESSVQVKEKRKVDSAEKPSVPEAASANSQRDRPKMIGTKVKGQSSVGRTDFNTAKNAKMEKDLSLGLSATSEGKQQSSQPGGGTVRKRKPTSFPDKVRFDGSYSRVEIDVNELSLLRRRKTEVNGDSHLNESPKTESILDVLVSRFHVPACAFGLILSLPSSKASFGRVLLELQPNIQPTQTKPKDLATQIDLTNLIPAYWEGCVLDWIISKHLVFQPRLLLLALAEEGKKTISKTKRASQIVPSPKQGKSARPPECSSSSTDLGRIGTDPPDSNVQVSAINEVSLPTKLRSRRKIGLQKALRKEPWSADNVANDRPDKYTHLIYDRAADLKTKLSHGLSSPMLRRWCTFEWFYSAIDYPWFARSEFVEYLNHVGLGHVPRLTRVEWGVIRSSLGKPRRLSQQFLREERDKLEEYREKVRTHYTELRAGIREGLPTDLARPLSVGQRVIACHPKTREIHDGSVLTVDRNRCRVQFDRPELGVEFVMDIDCMPLNPLENLSEVLRRQSTIIDKYRENFNDLKLESQPKDSKVGGFVKYPLTESVENADLLSRAGSSNYPMNSLMKQTKGDGLDDVVQAKASSSEIASVQAAYGQPCTLAQIQAREADIKAMSELNRALDKKEALLSELKHMNEEVSASQKEGDTIRDENFRRQYATVLVQLNDASYHKMPLDSTHRKIHLSDSSKSGYGFDYNDSNEINVGGLIAIWENIMLYQSVPNNTGIALPILVASAVAYLRQRNTFQGNSIPPWFSRPVGNSGGPAGPPSSFDHSTFSTQDSGSQVVEIVESSRQKARTMVDAAMQAMSTLREGEDALGRIGEAIDSASNKHPGADSGVSSVRSVTPTDQGHVSDQGTSCTSEPTAVNASGVKQNSSDVNEVQLPSELISSCVATLLMIQTCTERQYPPAEVAQILDSAVTNLQPCCTQNLPIYRDIQQCIGIVKNQVLALIPTQTTVLPTELSTV